MTNIKVAENWYNGLSAQTDHLFTDGITIWSYGRHFPIATRKNGKIYWNKCRYSMTTSQHQSHVARILGFGNAKTLEKAKCSWIILVENSQELNKLINDAIE